MFIEIKLYGLYNKGKTMIIDSKSIETIRELDSGNANILLKDDTTIHAQNFDDIKRQLFSKKDMQSLDAE
jgi:hypothetical protein